MHINQSHISVSEESLYERCKKQMILMEEIYDRGIMYQNEFHKTFNVVNIILV